MKSLLQAEARIKDLELRAQRAENDAERTRLSHDDQQRRHQAQLRELEARIVEALKESNFYREESSIAQKRVCSLIFSYGSSEFRLKSFSLFQIMELEVELRALRAKQDSTVAGGCSVELLNASIQQLERDKVSLTEAAQRSEEKHARAQQQLDRVKADWQTERQRVKALEDQLAQLQQSRGSSTSSGLQSPQNSTLLEREREQLRKQVSECLHSVLVRIVC